MKKIIYTVFILLLSISAFAQSEKEYSVSNEKSSRYGFYRMQDDYLIYYKSEGFADTLTGNISLRNGKTLTSIGELFDKDGTRVFLKEGECVNAGGNIEDCEKLKQKLFKKMDKKINPVSLVINPFFIF